MFIPRTGVVVRLNIVVVSLLDRLIIVTTTRSGGIQMKRSGGIQLNERTQTGTEVVSLGGGFVFLHKFSEFGCLIQCPFLRIKNVFHAKKIPGKQPLVKLYIADGFLCIGLEIY